MHLTLPLFDINARVPYSQSVNNKKVRSNKKNAGSFRKKTSPPERHHKIRAHPQKEYEGIISVTRRGVGYLPHESLSDDIEIAAGKLNCALNGDAVRVATLGTTNGRMQGEVTAVLSRAQTEFVGTLVEEKGFLTLHTDNVRMYVPIRIPEQRVLENAHAGYKAVVQMDSWDNPLNPPLGSVVRVLGVAGAHETEMQAALASHGFVPSFPTAVEKEAKEIAARGAVQEGDLKTRRDFRDVPTFTIDPDDAKDFDDALSFRRNDDGSVEVGIHIADVTHYVRPGSVLDNEARHRATSVYLVDRTIPMLPEELSNDICSLVPYQDRLVFSAVFTVAHDGRILERWFGKSVIRSAHRFTYQSAQDVLDGKEDCSRMNLRNLTVLATFCAQSAPHMAPFHSIPTR